MRDDTHSYLLRIMCVSIKQIFWLSVLASMVCWCCLASQLCHFAKFCADWDLNHCNHIGSAVKNLPAKAGDVGRAPGGGNGKPLQHSCLENPMNREAWWATIHRVAKSPTQLSTHTHTHTHTKDYWMYNMFRQVGIHSNIPFCYHLPSLPQGGVHRRVN